MTQASLSIYLLPVFGVLLSTIFVGERITTSWCSAACSYLAGHSSSRYTKNANGSRKRHMKARLELTRALLNFDATGHASIRDYLLAQHAVNPVRKVGARADVIR